MAATGVSTGCLQKVWTLRRNHPKEIDERKKQLHVFTRFRVSCLFGWLAKIAGIEKGHLKTLALDNTTKRQMKLAELHDKLKKR